MVQYHGSIGEAIELFELLEGRPPRLTELAAIVIAATLPIKWRHNELCRHLGHDLALAMEGALPLR